MLTPDAPLPPLRQDLEAVPIEHEGRPMFLLRDLSGLSAESLGLSPGGMMIASLLDGKRSASEISALFAKSTGTFLKTLEIDSLVSQLGQAGLLETAEVAARRAAQLQAFLDSPTRKAVHQGQAYPADSLKLAGQLGGYFKDPKGPGKEAASDPLSPPLRGLVCPHIDFPRGGPAYAWAFQALSECRPPDLIVALGVAHMSPDSPWIMTRKSYETPYGAMEVDSGLYDEIRSELWYDPRDDEWAHRGEHSLEFSAVWLKHLWREKAPRWVPILCSSFDRFCPDRAPSSVPTIETALAKIGEKLAARQRAGASVLVLMGVDLAHVGPRFGDELELDDALLRRVEDEDRKSLDLALALDADRFYLSVVADGHWRRVCGLSALYTGLRLLKSMDGEKARAGELLAYAQAPDPMGGVVSFSSARFA